MYNEFSVTLQEIFRKNKELLNTPDKFIEEVRCSFEDNATLSEKTYTTLKNALENRLIVESLHVIDKAEPLRYKAELVDKIYLRSFLRILEDILGMDSETAMFMVIPNLFYILGLRVIPDKDDNKIIITISDLSTQRYSGAREDANTQESKKYTQKNAHKRKIDEEYHKTNKPYRISALLVKWIVVIIFIAFCTVIIYSTLFPPDSLIQMGYSLLCLGLAGLADFLLKITKSIVPMFDKHVEKEEDLNVQIILKSNDIGTHKT